MNFSPMLMCKIIAGLLAFVCTVLLTLDLPFSRTLGVSLSHVAIGCRRPAEDTGATVHRVFNETIGLDMLSRKNRSDQRLATRKAKWEGLWVRRNETYKQGWGISMFHALHCLEMIRDHFEDGASHHTSAIFVRPVDNEEGNYHNEAHVQHCFAYIAQVCYSHSNPRVQRPPVLVLWTYTISVRFKDFLPVNQIECSLFSHPLFRLSTAHCHFTTESTTV